MPRARGCAYVYKEESKVINSVVHPQSQWFRVLLEPDVHQTLNLSSLSLIRMNMAKFCDCKNFPVDDTDETMTLTFMLKLFIIDCLLDPTHP